MLEFSILQSLRLFFLETEMWEKVFPIMGAVALNIRYVIFVFIAITNGILSTKEVWVEDTLEDVWDKDSFTWLIVFISATHSWAQILSYPIHLHCTHWRSEIVTYCTVASNCEIKKITCLAFKREVQCILGKPLFCIVFDSVHYLIWLVLFFFFF